MSEKMRFRLAARCEAAGRPNNEDNYKVESDLSIGKGFNGDDVLPLGNKGALLLVCDGMGGMNAGEVASKIAVDTVMYRFSPDNLANALLDNDERRCDFIRHVIQEADTNIKQESKTDPSKSGMGSTIVLAWLVDEKVYVGWCGDSRAYKYNPQQGFVQLSHDHSYVQELVDSGKLSPELAFDHPNNNIITRSLGDPRGTAQPDVKVYPLEENDVILLCSDGLCGVLRDHEMGRIIASCLNSMVSCRDALWEAARNAGWHDNVTIALAQIMSKNAAPVSAKPSESQPRIVAPTTPQPVTKTKIWDNKYFKIGCVAVAVLLVVLVVYLILLKSRPNGENTPQPTDVCGQWKPLIDEYETINPNDDKKKIMDSVYKDIDKIIECNELKDRVKEITKGHLETVERSDMGDNELLKEINKKL